VSSAMSLTEQDFQAIGGYVKQNLSAKIREVTQPPNLI
jgi:hypothetical protein